MMALFSFLAAMRVFTHDHSGVSPYAYRWSYGLTTSIIVVFPVAQGGGFGDAAAQRFYERILDLAFVCSYLTLGTLAYDAAAERLRAWRGWPVRNGYA